MRYCYCIKKLGCVGNFPVDNFLPPPLLKLCKTQKQVYAMKVMQCKCSKLKVGMAGAAENVLAQYVDIY